MDLEGTMITFFNSYFTWVFIQMKSYLFSHEAQGQDVPNSFDCRDGFSLLVCSEYYVLSVIQWKVAILILINTSASITFRIVTMKNWLNLNKCPSLLRLNLWHFCIWGKPWTTRLCSNFISFNLYTLKCESQLFGILPLYLMHAGVLFSNFIFFLALSEIFI